MEDWTEAYDNYWQVDTVYMDFRKAFGLNNILFDIEHSKHIYNIQDLAVSLKLILRSF